MIATNRLRLRPHVTKDIDAYVRLWAADPQPDPRGVPGFALTPEECWSRLLRFVGHRAAFGFAPFLIVDSITGGVVGEAGYGYFRRGFGPDYDYVPEAMWKIASDRRGDGLAREAMVAATAALDRAGSGARSVCVIDPRNTPSMRIATRLGFAPYAEQDYRSARRVLLQRMLEAARTTAAIPIMQVSAQR